MIYRIILTLLLTLTGSAMLSAQEHGTASYYSNRMHGRRMSDGTRYHKDSLTCAHKRYALGTKLKVTNPRNGKSVVVKVTDRCGGRRIIDLSYAAAKQLGIIALGIATVRVERYIENRGIPFKPDDEDDMPELDYEVTEGKKDNTPQWLEDKEVKQSNNNTKKASAKKKSGTRKRR